MDYLENKIEMFQS